MDNAARYNPLQNDVVLKTLFIYLNEKDIKSCRLVCLKWEEISREYFVKLAKVFIKSSKYNGLKMLATFQKIFPDVSLMPISKFHFSGFFPENQLKVIINSFPSLTELLLDSFVLQGYMVNEYVMSGWNTLNLKTLSCVGRECPHKWSTKMIIPLSRISSIQYLHLDGPFSVLIDGPISPKEIFIDGGVTFLWLGTLKKRMVHLNDFMHLKMLRKLNFNQSHPSTFTADVTDCQNLESVSSFGGSLSGLSGLSPHLKIKELTISTPCDVSFLPTTIEKLRLGRDHVFCTSEVNLPNLQYLHTNYGSYLHKFANCPNLTDLVIGKYFNYTRPVQIPLNTLRMSFKAKALIYFQFWRNNIFILDYLHLELIVANCNADQDMRSLSFKKAFTILEFVRAKSLVISFEESKRLYTSHHCLVDKLIEIVKMQSEREGTVYFGGIEWDTDCPSLMEIVDMKTAFYLFQNGHGKGIEENEFKKMNLLGSFLAF